MSTFRYRRWPYIRQSDACAKHTKEQDNLGNATLELRVLPAHRRPEAGGRDGDLGADEAPSEVPGEADRERGEEALDDGKDRLTLTFIER